MRSTPGEYTATRPLEIVQIDHTLVDVIVVYEQSCEPMMRPWITLAIDVLTRMVAGFHLSRMHRREFRLVCACCMQCTTRPPG